MDNKDKSGSPDRDRINVNQDFELDYWCKKFNVSEEELRDAVKRAGTSAVEVEKLLKKG
jgi:hypothetical protein